MSVAMYQSGLRGDEAVFVRHRGGRAVPLNVDRWQGPARGADETLLGRVSGAALDVGCGPGRLVAALTSRGMVALGIDIAPAAVGLTRRAGGRALQLSVFDDVPYAGSWDTVVLADGNIGIGGDPHRLLLRSAELLSARGKVLVELDAPNSGAGAELVRLEDANGNAGAWFPWASVAANSVDVLAASARLRVLEEWTALDDPSPQARWFAALGHA